MAEEIRRLRQWIASASDNQLSFIFLVAVAVSVCFRTLNALLHPGFVTGDDVELHEMTLGHMFSQDWTVWSLRSPLYPMIFLYPIQRFASYLGAEGAGALVAVGRLTVVAISTASVWLVYRIARELTGRNAAVLALVLFASSRLHMWYGSSELPRPVASAFVLLAFLLLLRRNAAYTVGAGAALAIGASLRFAEIVFLAPAVLQLVFERRWKDALVVSFVAAVLGAALLGIADTLYWGKAFYSLENAYRYTVVERQSSRGFQPLGFYLTSASAWTNYVVLALSMYSIQLRDNRATFWAWLPLIALSVLPHKEARYVIAAHPFVCISAAMAADDLFRRWGDGPNKNDRLCGVLALALTAAVVVELGDWHARRTDRAVAFARELAAIEPRGVAAQQLWRFGGRLYLSSVPTLTELPEESSAALDVVKRRDYDWILLRNNRNDPDDLERLERRGYMLTQPDGLDYLVFRKGAARRH